MNMFEYEWVYVDIHASLHIKFLTVVTSEDDNFSLEKETWGKNTLEFSYLCTIWFSKKECVYYEEQNGIFPLS